MTEETMETAAVVEEVEIEDADVVEKSYPAFWKDLEKAGFEEEVKGERWKVKGAMSLRGTKQSRTYLVVMRRRDDKQLTINNPHICTSANLHIKKIWQAIHSGKYSG